MKEILKELKQYRGKIPKQALKTIRGQALSGNIEAARKGLERIKERQGNNNGYDKSKEQYKRGWNHVSVSHRNKTPSWEEMCMVKDTFYEAIPTPPKEQKNLYKGGKEYDR